jgi:hypothetical protein
MRYLHYVRKSALDISPPCLRSADRQDRASVSFKFVIRTGNRQQSRRPRSQRSPKVEKQAGSVRLVSIVVGTTLPLIAGYDCNPAVESLDLEYSRSGKSVVASHSWSGNSICGKRVKNKVGSAFRRESETRRARREEKNRGWHSILSLSLSLSLEEISSRS